MEEIDAKSADNPGVTPKSTEGWRSRGYLPHLDTTHRVQHVTFHLADSLPQAAVERMAAELASLPQECQSLERRRRMQALADAGHGACWLRRADCAALVQDSLLHFDAVRYHLIAWVVMPNHVHVLFQALAPWTPASIIGSWKTFTANRIGRLVVGQGERRPPVWHPEYWDRYIRDRQHFAKAVAYIHQNPVAAGLVARVEDWPWSSAATDMAKSERFVERLGGTAAERGDEGASPEPRDPRIG